MRLSRVYLETTSRRASPSALRAKACLLAACLLLGSAHAGAARSKELPDKELPARPEYRSVVFSGNVDPSFRYEVRALNESGELISSFPVYSRDGAVLSGDTLRVDGARYLQTAVWMADELLMVSEPRDFELGVSTEVTFPKELGALELVPVSVSVSEVQVSKELRRYDFNVVDAEGRQLPLDPKLVDWSWPFDPDIIPVIPEPPMKCLNSPSCIFVPVPPEKRLERVLTVCLGPLCALNTVPDKEPPPPKWRSIKAGPGFSCGLTTEGRVLCWGEAISGQLGQPASHCVLPPSAPPTAKCGWVPRPIVQPPGSLSTFQDLDVGENHACAVDTSGALWCWGQLSFENGSLCPNGAASCNRAPFRLNPNDPSVPNVPAKLKSVSAGGRHTCAITVGGSALCFGKNTSGESGADQAGVTFNAVGPAGHYESVSAGSRHSCALTTAGGVECWGWTIEATRLHQSLPGAIIFLGTPRDAVPEHPSLKTRADRVSAGSARTCIHAVDGTLSCLDETNTTNFRWDVEHVDPVTTQLETAINAPDIKCQVESDKLFCDLPQAGVRHTHLPFSNAATDCSVEAEHGCAVEADGTAWCWGENKEGQLGDGSVQPADPMSPVAVLLP